jgi:hypothetical protein
MPNPPNMTSPNLMLLKLSLMGLPASVGVTYLGLAIAIALAGAIGTRQCLAGEFLGTRAMRLSRERCALIAADLGSSIARGPDAGA